MPSLFRTRPDYRRLLASLTGAAPDRMPVYEFFSDLRVQEEALDGWTPPALPDSGTDWINRLVAAQYGLGYDYVPISVPFGFPSYNTQQTLDSQGNTRFFLDEHNVPVVDRATFEALRWPTPDDADFGPLDTLCTALPEGMLAIANLGGGLLEWAMWLMGAEGFSYAIYDQPELVRDLLDTVNAQQAAVARLAAQRPNVMAVALGDDMGFKTQTFLPPRLLRTLIFPGLRRVADAIHAEGKPFILHSCGNLTAVMDDLIDDVRIDAKHSYEDAIMPVTDVKARWGGRVGILGGVDMDMLCRAPEHVLRATVRHIVERCAPGGRFALGSGNSIANYVPPASLRIMLDEAFKAAAA